MYIFPERNFSWYTIWTVVHVQNSLIYILKLLNGLSDTLAKNTYSLSYFISVVATQFKYWNINQIYPEKYTQLGLIYKNKVVGKS